MSRSCDICCKGVQHGNKISKSYNHTKRTWRPNLVKIRTDIDGRAMTLTVCTRCLRSDFLTKKVHVPKPVAESAN